jgi:PAS domain S-box-containing protein
VSRIEENALFEALARAGDGALIADARGRVVIWNKSAERLLGWTASEAIGRSSCELLDGHDADGTRTCGDGCPVAASASGTVESFDVRTATRSGRPVCLNVSTLSIVSDDTGRMTIHLFREVADRRALAPHGVLGVDEEPQEVGPLTRREREVLRLLASGANTRIAAQRLGVSPATVRNHVQNMLGKLGVHSRLQAVAYATTHGLL